jgi:hypothetical protein
VCNLYFKTERQRWESVAETTDKWDWSDERDWSDKKKMLVTVSTAADAQTAAKIAPTAMPRKIAISSLREAARTFQTIYAADSDRRQTSTAACPSIHSCSTEEEAALNL